MLLCVYCNMEQKVIPLGSRKLQQVCRSLTINVPRVAVNTLELKAGELMSIEMMPDYSLRLVKE